MRFNIRLLTIFLCPLLTGLTQVQAETTRHQDYRSSVKVDFAPKAQRHAKSLSATDLARAYGQTWLSQQQISVDMDQLKLSQVKESLLATHYHFQQFIEGTPISAAELIVSVNKDDQSLMQVFNNLYPVNQPLTGWPSAKLSADQAYDLAWSHLSVQGELLSAPSAALVYEPVNGSFRQAYLVKLYVSRPYGDWEILVDANNKKVLRAEDLRTDLQPEMKRLQPAGDKAINRQKAFKAFFQKSYQKYQALGAPTESGNGTAIVFDPDPRTAMQNKTINDNSPAAEFEAAYVERELLDLSISNGTYTLKGPWVQIDDFDSPTQKPSTTNDGHWTARRGNNAFNDAMTYFHIDQNQRYMQSLGFKESTGIQYGSIKADANGASGADNSFFSPTSNHVSFGHGCVDDNEDADVILHEYGHAINYSINNNWRGGDTGAMGEGFGDYWAGSYSISTEFGPVFEAGRVFTWDGEPCWPGRSLSAAHARYNHRSSYRAHQTVGNFISDELWSTPLFQALLNLTQLGHPRTEIDQVILQAHFGLGANLKMRDMANSIVKSAKALYPLKPYAQVFTEQFTKHGIL